MGLGLVDRLNAARTFGPDLVVAEGFDPIGGLTAAVQDVPWACRLINGLTPPGLFAAVRRRASAAAGRVGLEAAPPIHRGPFPDLLRTDDGRRAAAGRIPIRPTAFHAPSAVRTEGPEKAGRISGAVRVLVPSAPASTSRTRCGPPPSR